MRSILLITTLLIIQQVSGQDQQKIDSLLNLIDTEVSDQQKADIYNQIALNYRTVDSASAMRYIKLATDLSLEIGYDVGRVDALTHQGWIMVTNSDYEQAESIFTLALELAEQSDYAVGQAESNQNIGVSYWYRGRYSPALDYYFKALRKWEEVDDAFGMAGARMNIGIISWNLGDNSKASENISAAIKIYESLGDHAGIAKGYTNLGVIFEEAGDLQGALENYLKSQKILIDIGDKRVLAYNYSNVGIIYDLRKQYDSSYYYFTMSLELFDEIGSKAEMTLPLIDLGKSFYRQKNYALARRYLKEGVNLARETNFLSSVRDGSEYLALTEQSLGNYQQAYEAHTLFKSVADSITNDEQTRKITKLEADYEFQKERDSLSFVQERERIAYEADIVRRSTAQWITLGGLVVVVAFLIGFVVFNRKLSRLNAEISAQRDDLSRMNKAKSRFFSIIAHDIRGPMGVIIGMSEIITRRVLEDYGSKDKELEEMTSALKTSSRRVVNLLDNLMKWALKEEGLMPFQPELISLNECVNETIALLKPQAGSKNISLHVEMSETLEGKLDRNRILTVFRNLISNSIKFTPEGGDIFISGKKEHAHTEIIIRDTGVGIPKKNLASIYEINKEKVSKGTKGELGTGLGLNLVRDFIHRNKGEISVESKEGVGTTFVLTFPIS